MLKAITFDCWNTLIYLNDPAATFEHRAERVRQAISRQGLDLPVEGLSRELREIWEQTLRQQIELGVDHPPIDQVLQLVARYKLKGDPASIQDLYRAYTEAVLEDPPRLMPGAAEVLQQLSRKFKLGLICNTGSTPGAVLRKILQQYQLANFLREKLFSNELGIAKPNPEIFRLALEKMGVKAEEALHVGDDPVTDILGAHQVGMKTIWLNCRRSGLKPPFDWQVSSLLEIPALLLEVEK